MSRKFFHLCGASGLSLFSLAMLIPIFTCPSESEAGRGHKANRNAARKASTTGANARRPAASATSRQGDALARSANHLVREGAASTGGLKPQPATLVGRQTTSLKPAPAALGVKKPTKRSQRNLAERQNAAARTQTPLYRLPKKASLRKLISPEFPEALRPLLLGQLATIKDRNLRLVLWHGVVQRRSEASIAQALGLSAAKVKALKRTAAILVRVEVPSSKRVVATTSKSDPTPRSQRVKSEPSPSGLRHLRKLGRLESRHQDAIAEIERKVDALMRGNPGETQRPADATHRIFDTGSTPGMVDSTFSPGDFVTVVGDSESLYLDGRPIDRNVNAALPAALPLRLKLQGTQRGSGLRYWTFEVTRPKLRSGQDKSTSGDLFTAVKVTHGDPLTSPLNLRISSY